MKSMRSGFTFIELVVLMGIFGVLAAITTINLLGAERKPALTSSVHQLITDIRAQQFRAISGDAQEGLESLAYGIYFGTNEYVLFSGDSYTAGNPGNATIHLETPLEFFTVTLPGSTLLFHPPLGDIDNLTSNTNTITLGNSQNQEQRTITINSYGAITEVNEYD